MMYEYWYKQHSANRFISEQIDKTHKLPSQSHFPFPPQGPWADITNFPHFSPPPPVYLTKIYQPQRRAIFTFHGEHLAIASTNRSLNYKSSVYMSVIVCGLSA